MEGSTLKHNKSSTSNKLTAIIGSLLLRILLIAFFSPWAQIFGESVENEWIDLSYPFNNETIYWPGSKSFNHTVVFANFTDAGFYYSSYDISASEHGGTHLDSPVHFAQGKWTTDQIPLHRLIGPAVKIDISARAAKNPDAQLMVSDLEAWEYEHGKVPDDAILLMFSGWGKYWSNRTSYLGTDTMNTSLLHFPGIHPNASRWLVRNRKIKLVGVDTASLDYGQSKKFESHQILFAENIPGLENVAHIDKLPPKGATLFAAPMFISGGSGGPCRIFARLENGDKNKCVDSAGIAVNSGHDGAIILGIGVFLFLLF